ncbi:hypothetical protein LDENG_00071890, partial [Lucifuga dentata]
PEVENNYVHLLKCCKIYFYFAVFSASFPSHFTGYIVLISLHWLLVKFRIHFKILVLTFRALSGQSPMYISELLQPYVTSRSLRSSDQGLLFVPRSRLKTTGDCVFQVVAPKLWNSVPLEIRTVDTVDAFKKKLKTYLFRSAFA